MTFRIAVIPGAHDLSQAAHAVRIQADGDTLRRG